MLGGAVLCLLGTAAAAAPVVLDGATGSISLAGHIEVFRDNTGQLGIEDVVHRHFTPVSGNLAAGFDRSAFWLRIPLERGGDGPIVWLLEVGMPYLDHVDLYSSNPAGEYDVAKMGDRLPFAERSLPYRNFLFKLTPPVGSSEIYLRIQTTSTVIVYGDVWTQDAFGVMAGRGSIVLGLIHGAMLILILSALVQALVTRQRVYGIYAIYATLLELMFVSMNGLGGQFFFPRSPMLADGMTGMSTCLAAGFGAFLGSLLLNMARRHPWIHRSYQVCGTFSILSALSIFVDKYYLVGQPVQAIVLYLCIMQPLVALPAALRGDREAATYLLSWLLQLLSLSLLVLRNLGMSSLAFVPDLFAQVTAALHVLVISGGLGLRIAAIKREKRAVQAALLNETQRNKRELEGRVAERTSELAAENAERRVAEMQLRESETQLRAMLDAAPFPMVVTRIDDGSLLYLNTPAAVLFGQAEEKGDSRTSIDFYDNADIPPRLIESLHTNGVVAGEEVLFRRMDGARHWIMLSAVRFRYGGEDAVMSCLNDITARKQLEQSLIDARERSDAALALQQQAMAEQRNFLSMVSHEFRTPLSIIGAASDLIELKSEQNGRTEPGVAKIRRAIQRMTDLIDTCLADEWVASTMTSPCRQPVDLGAVLREVADERGEIAAQAILLMLPPEPVVVLGDVSLLRVAVSNLLDNAIKYSPASGEIRVILRSDYDQAVLTVADDGPGVASQEATQIFEKFYRSNAAFNKGGAGLGLYLVKQIAERHGGGIRLERVPGTGATFVMELPVQ